MKEIFEFKPQHPESREFNMDGGGGGGGGGGGESFEERLSRGAREAFAAGPDASVEWLLKDPEQAEMKMLSEKFRGIVDSFFAEDQDADWVIIGDESGSIIDSGKDPALFSQARIAELEVELGQRLHVFGRPVFLEPTSPDPNAPSVR